MSDGDTLMAFTSEGTKLRIRLVGIDAPEIPPGKKWTSPLRRKHGTTWVS